ncbi:hypothetical protein AB0C65_00170 [Nocardia sp. NPDC048505]|uniref:hypothetical protein n=1 Tax=Nocardia sp. NPDC048505 TaxID=3155756 RepID=UPI00340C214C
MAEKKMQSYIDAAQNGQLSMKFNSGDVSVNAEEFVYIDRDCQAMKDKIRELQRIAQSIAKRDVWGLGDRSDWLLTAPMLVGRFRSKADGAKDGNDVNAILQKHFDIIEGIQELHKQIALRYVEADTTFAARYNELMASLPQGFQVAK